MTLPSLLIVPGAWHRPDHFRLLIDELAGIDVRTVTLASSGFNPAALGDMYADAEAIAQAVAAIDGPVVASSTWPHSSFRPVSRFYPTTGVRSCHGPGSTAATESAITSRP